MTQSNYTYGEDTPISNFLEEVLTHLDLFLHELSTYVGGEKGYRMEEAENWNTFDKVKSAADTIRRIQASATQYNIRKTNKKLYDFIYDNILIPLHSINKDTDVKQLEMILHNGVKLVKNAIGPNLFHNTKMNVDDYDEGYDLYYRQFEQYPVKNAMVLYGLRNGSIKSQEYKTSKTEYINNKIQQWVKENNNQPMPNKEKNSFIDQEIKKDFNELWKTELKSIWEKEFLELQQRLKQKYGHLKESVRQKLLKQFIRN